MGEQQLKNIVRPVRVYRVGVGAPIAVPSAEAPDEAVKAPLPLPDKPSVAVLPFANMSSDPEQDFFAHGISEDIITALSRYPSLFVIARNSSFTYKGRSVDVKQIGGELGVRYLLEGSLRRAGNRIRVTAQLVEAETGKHVWAERYDRELADIFAVQDEITQAATIAIAPAIAQAELHRALRRPPENLDAWAAYQRGLWHFSKANVEDNGRAEASFQLAIDLDPTFAGGYKGLALAINNSAAVYGIRSLGEGFAAAEVLARQAVELDGTDAEARTRLAATLWMRADYAGALAEVDRALAISPNLAYAHGIRGSTLISCGQPKKGLAALETCIRLDPRDPNLANRLTHVAAGLYYCREYEAAIGAAKRAIRSYPKHPMAYRWLAAALGQTDQAEEAKKALKKAIAIAPGSFEMYVRGRAPWMQLENHAHMLEGLRKAGWEG